MDVISFTRSILPSAVVSAGGASLGCGGSAGGASLGRGGSTGGASLQPAEDHGAGEASGGSGVAAERRQGRTEQISKARFHANTTSSAFCFAIYSCLVTAAAVSFSVGILFLFI